MSGGRAEWRSDELLASAIAQARAVEVSGAPAIVTLRHLAARMDVDYRYLRSVIANRAGDRYRDFSISKRGGGGRRIAVPEARLMAVQRWIVREILRGRPVHPDSHAYAAGSSIVACAQRHCMAGWLLKLDIHDFFESVPERSVYDVFRAIGYQPLVSFELARLCTRPWVVPPEERRDARTVRNYSSRGIELYRRELTGHLPQGAPTSPMLSNLACVGLDGRLSALAHSARLTYTRYSDDLTFSGPPGTFDRAGAVAMVDGVRDILRSYGFRMHEQKISIVPPGGRKVVLGLLVDRQRPRLPGELRRRLLDHVRGVEGFGIARHAVERNFEAPTGMVNHIAGLLRFARDVEPAFADPLRTRFEAALVRHGWGAGP